MGVYNDGSTIIHKSGEGTAGDLVWASDAAPAALLPDSETITFPATINFPDFDKGNCAVFSLNSDGTDSGAISWATILPGEWHYQKTGSKELAQTLLGTVPSGINYLDVSINLSRTNAPDQVLGNTVPIVGIKPGKWSDLDGGCAVLERMPAFLRAIQVVRSGNNIYLRRIQSVKDADEAAVTTLGIAYKTGAQVWSSGALSPWHNLATHGGDARGHVVYELDRKGYGGNINKQRGGANEPSFTDPSDFSCTYEGTVRFRPGYIPS